MRTLRNDRLSLTVAPERGGKIVSLLGADGTEWLTTSAEQGFAVGTAFGEAEMAGWDECAPTIDACTVDGSPLPDHGDVWDACWTGEADDLAVDGSSWPYRLRRRLLPLADGGWRLEYRARATGNRPIPFLWAAHPQFAAPVGTRVELSGAPTMVDVLDPARPERPWSPDDGSFAALPPDGCRKLYVHPSERVHAATLRRPDGAALWLRWSASIPYLGL